MQKVRKEETVDRFEISQSDFSELISLYDASSLKLHQCALHVPGNDNTQDTDIEKQEGFYIDMQQSLLESACGKAIEDEADIKNILQLWLRQRATEHQLTPSDKLILALCKHYTLF